MRRTIVLVGDLLLPIGRASRRYGEMEHGGIGTRPVPRELAGRGIYHVPGTDLDCRSILVLDEARSCEDVEHLTLGMAVPVASGARANWTEIMVKVLSSSISRLFQTDPVKCSVPEDRQVVLLPVLYSTLETPHAMPERAPN